jgi:hypothetical protein
VAEDIERRKALSFEQAEGIEPLPSQLELRKVSPQLRAVLWNQIHRYLTDATHSSDYGTPYLDEPRLVGAAGRGHVADLGVHRWNYRRFREYLAVCAVRYEPVSLVNWPI